MPNLIQVDPKQGIPPFEEPLIEWNADDGPLVAEIAAQVLTLSDSVQDAVRIAADIVRYTARLMDRENDQSRATLEAHHAQHSRLVRPDMEMTMALSKTPVPEPVAEPRLHRNSHKRKH